MRINNNSGNSILLAGVKLITTLNSLIITMVLSKTMSLNGYGTYSQTLIVVTVATTLSVLGLTDAANFFFNRTSDAATQRKYSNHIFSILVFTGICVAGGILIGQDLIVDYFSNPALKSLLLLVAFRPFLANFTLLLQVLHVAIGQSRVIVVRNLLVSILQLAAVVIISMTTSNLFAILLVYLLLEILVNVLLVISLRNFGVRLRLIRPEPAIVKEILRFSLPMAAYVLMNTLMRDMDKLVIGGLETTEALAIYSNCGKILPFDFLSASFLTILVPVVTRYLNQNENGKASEVFSLYLKIGCMSTWVFTTVALLCPDQIISFLYSREYLVGKSIFILYIIVEMVKFANISLILSASGKTKQLMYISAAGLAANLILDLLLYRLVGFIGPALATVIVTLMTVVLLFRSSIKALQCRIRNVMDWKFLLGFLAKSIAGSAVCILVKLWLTHLGLHDYLILFLIAGIYGASMLALNLREIKGCLMRLNQYR